MAIQSMAGSEVQRLTDIDAIDGKFKGFGGCDTIDGRFGGCEEISIHSTAGSGVQRLTDIDAIDGKFKGSEVARRYRYNRWQVQGFQRFRGDIDGRFRGSLISMQSMASSRVSEVATQSMAGSEVQRLRGDIDTIDGRFRGSEGARRYRW